MRTCLIRELILTSTRAIIVTGFLASSVLPVYSNGPNGSSKDTGKILDVVAFVGSTIVSTLQSFDVLGVSYAIVVNVGYITY